MFILKLKFHLKFFLYMPFSFEIYLFRRSCDPSIIKYEMDFNLCLERMVDDLQIRMKISDQVLQYKRRLGHFATSLATNINETMDPCEFAFEIYIFFIIILNFV